MTEQHFSDFATAVLAAYLADHPVEATYLGEHSYDDRLDDPSPAAAATRGATVRAQLAQLGEVSTGSVGDSVEDSVEDSVDNRDDTIDAAVLRTALHAELLNLSEVREPEWNPMEHNPGPALHALASRAFAPVEQRLAAAAARMRAVPDYLDAARGRLGRMSRVHAETALAQLNGTRALVEDVLPGLAADATALAAEVAGASAMAAAAVDAHQVWLRERLGAADRDPRLGEQLFARKLELALDTAFEPGALLAAAEADLARVTMQITEVAGRLAAVTAPDSDTVRTVLDGLAADAPTDATILGLCRASLQHATDFVRERQLVTVHTDAIDVVQMPEIDRGVAVAYCRPPGPLERMPLATEFAVAPTPAGWSAEQVTSFYREYNVHMLHNLTVHEAMPGHALQLMHSNRNRATNHVRAVWTSGSFVEGWAVYTEELMVGHGYRGGADGDARAGDALRMQQLKMQLRMILNAILDIRFHCDGLDESEAMRLMTDRGFQEQGEAIGKWRRVQLTATQLSTYYVGYREVRDLVADVRAARPAWSERELHDAILAHGSPPARHLRRLLLHRG